MLEGAKQHKRHSSLHRKLTLRGCVSHLMTSLQSSAAARKVPPAADWLTGDGQQHARTFRLQVLELIDSSTIRKSFSNNVAHGCQPLGLLHHPPSTFRHKYPSSLPHIFSPTSFANAPPVLTSYPTPASHPTIRLRPVRAIVSHHGEPRSAVQELVRITPLAPRPGQQSSKT